MPACTDHTVVAVERDGIPIMLHTHVNNLVARHMIETGVVPEMAGSTLLRSEVTIGRSRFDFLFQQGGREIVVEVKSCTLVGNRIAMFPDAVTARGTRHLLELAELGKASKQSVVLFMVHWERADYFMPDWHTDFEFSRTLLAVRDNVLVKAVSVPWRENLTPGRAQEIAIPWNIVEQEAQDRGAYIVIVKLKRDRKAGFGGRKCADLRRGYYCAVASAGMNLGKQIQRHQRSRKNMLGYIDYLRDIADFHAALPIRSSDELECEIAKALSRIADWEAPGIGSSDCGCKSHVFGMKEDPLHNRAFIELLIYFRIDRLETYLNAP